MTTNTELIRRGNIYSDPRPSAEDAESFTPLLSRKNVRIERIISRGHTSPEGFFYDQTENEYVLVVEGSAELEIEGLGPVRLARGDWLEIPAHVRHRVTWTHPDVDTIWLAVFY